MKKIFLTACAALLSTQAMALEFGVFGTAGYSNVKGDDADSEMSGYNLGVTALYNVMPLNDKLSLAVGAGVNYTRVNHSENDVNVHWSFVHLSPEVGLNIAVSSDFHVIPTVNFGYGNKCEAEVEYKGFSLTDSADSCNQYGLNTRATYAFTSNFTGMGQFQYDMGKIKNEGETFDYKTYAVSIGAGYQF